MKKKIFTLLTLLLCVVGSTWGADFVDDYATLGSQTSDYVAHGISRIALGENSTIGNNGITIAKNKTGQFTISVPDGFTIKSVTFSDNGRVKSATTNDASGTCSNNSSSKVTTYIASSGITSVTFFLTENNKGNLVLTNFAVTTSKTPSDDYEKIIPSGTIADGAIPFTSSLGASKLVTTFAPYGGTSSASSGNVDFGNGKGVSITTSRAIKAIYTVWYQRCPSTDAGWTGKNSGGTTIGTYSCATNAWTAPDANTKFVSLVRGEGSTAKLSAIHIFYYEDLPTYTMTAAVDDAAHGTASVSAASVLQGSSATFTAENKVGWQFKNWTVTGSDPEEVVSTNNPYVIASATANVSLTANFEAATTYTVGYGVGTSGATTALTSSTAYNEGTVITLPASNHLFYKADNTVSKWTDGTNEYAFGADYTVNSDATISPVFTANAKSLGEEATTITWTFARDNGAPTYAIEGNGKTTSVIGTTANGIDLKLDVALTQNGNGSEYGKFNNTNTTTAIQVNAYSTFTIPAIKGMVVRYTATNGTPKTTDEVLFGSDHAASVDGQSLVYTYNGTGATLTITDNQGNYYPSGITVSYPVRPTKWSTPTITVDNTFNFENKGYKVTITGEEILKVSTDGENYTTQTSPYVTYATTITHYYAKSTGDGLSDSDVADENVANAFNISKPYVAWVYENEYGVANYAFNTDPMVIALQSIYNVVEVKLAQSTDPTTATDISNADLIVCTEAMAGNKTLSNKMETYVGNTPMIGLKFFNYTSGRWDWGAPANPSSTTLGFTPSSTKYKVLDGVTYENDGTIKLATQSFNTGSQKNVVQTVTWSSAPASNVDMGTADEKVAMHCATKYFGLGLSSDCWQYYTANAITIVKNAAAMLIAGDALDAEVSSKTITVTATGFNTFSCSYPLDLSTISGGTAYYASAVDGGKVVFTKTTAKVPAGEGLFIKGDGANVTIDITNDATSAISGNLLVGLPSGGTVAEAGAGQYNYVFGWSNPSNPGFYKVGAASATLGAGKAYLHTTTALSTPGARLGIIFADETTGISDDLRVNSEEVANAPIFNLQGQRVNANHKGLVIKNGKKVIIK